ncbi:MAG: D-alanyl-D-alanine carboxypeptidase family protein [Ruminococcaceae bacterium]|nr:D-alanyl-D-alanine carboxypeptidase family protein [Oscillospiraceae bacterium]
MEPWNLVLVNPWNKLPSDFEVKRTQLSNGHSVDERAYPDLQQMMDDARAEGLSPIICSSFRTQQKQVSLFTNQVNRYLDRGYEYDDAVAEAGTAVAIPGTSEHQLGLAVDIVSINYQVLDEKQENTAEQKWLMENSYKYGWILRYPSDKSDITGIIYEPWHYRYVGKEAAKEIFEKGVCLEEYLEMIQE